MKISRSTAALAALSLAACVGPSRADFTVTAAKRDVHSSGNLDATVDFNGRASSLAGAFKESASVDLVGRLEEITATASQATVVPTSGDVLAGSSTIAVDVSLLTSLGHVSAQSSYDVHFSVDVDPAYSLSDMIDAERSGLGLATPAPAGLVDLTTKDVLFSPATYSGPAVLSESGLLLAGHSYEFFIASGVGDDDFLAGPLSRTGSAAWDFEFRMSAVPEPAGLLLLASGLVPLWA